MHITAACHGARPRRSRCGHFVLLSRGAELALGAADDAQGALQPLRPRDSPVRFVVPPRSAWSGSSAMAGGGHGARGTRWRSAHRSGAPARCRMMMQHEPPPTPVPAPARFRAAGPQWLALPRSGKVTEGGLAALEDGGITTRVCAAADGRQRCLVSVGAGHSAARHPASRCLTHARGCPAAASSFARHGSCGRLCSSSARSLDVLGAALP
jgi:hypothetical protein